MTDRSNSLRQFLFGALAVVGALSASAWGAEGTETSPVPSHIASIAGTVVYLEQGRDQGLERGQLLPILRDGKEIGQLELVHVSDHRAAARVKSAVHTLRLTDAVGVPAAKGTRPPPTRRLQYRVVPDSELDAAWSQSHAAAPPVLVAYTSDKAKNPTTARVRANAETLITAAVDVPELSTTRLEQVIALWAQGNDLGMQGLNFRIRADVDLRYDADTDRYLAGSHVYPLVREVALRYTPPRSAWSGTLGRFRPAVRQADLVEGAQVSWKHQRLEVVGYGGLKPSMLELAPQPDRQAYGVALNFSPDLSGLRWNGQLSYGGDLGSGAMLRQTLATDHHLTWGKLGAHQSLTLDFLAPGGASDGRTGVDVSEAYLSGNYQLSDQIALSASGRLNGRALLTPDAAELPDAWVDGMAGRRVMRAEGGAQFVLSSRRRVRPYLFWTEDTRTVDGVRERLAQVMGGGSSWHLDHLAGSGLGLDVSGDYGDGVRQQAALQVMVHGPAAKEALRVGGGMMHFWTFGHETGMHTFQHLAHVRVDGQVLERVGVWAMMMGGVDWNIAAGPFSPGGVLNAEAGATCWW